MTLALGSRWQKKPPGCEVVEVRRVWNYQGDRLTVRAHPVRGGKVLVAEADWFQENYALLPTAGDA